MQRHKTEGGSTYVSGNTRYIRQTLAHDEQLRSGLDVDSELEVLTGSGMGLA